MLFHACSIFVAVPAGSFQSRRAVAFGQRLARLSQALILVAAFLEIGNQRGKSGVVSQPVCVLGGRFSSKSASVSRSAIEKCTPSCWAYCPAAVQLVVAAADLVDQADDFIAQLQRVAVGLEATPRIIGVRADVPVVLQPLQHLLQFFEMGRRELGQHQLRRRVAGLPHRRQPQRNQRTGRASAAAIGPSRVPDAFAHRLAHLMKGLHVAIQLIAALPEPGEIVGVGLRARWLLLLIAAGQLANDFAFVRLVAVQFSGQ